MHVSRRLSSACHPDRSHLCALLLPLVPGLIKDRAQCAGVSVVNVIVSSLNLIAPWYPTQSNKARYSDYFSSDQVDF